MSVSSIELLTNMCNYVRPACFENLDYEPEGDTTMGRTMEFKIKQSKISHLKKIKWKSNSFLHLKEKTLHLKKKFRKTPHFKEKVNM